MSYTYLIAALAGFGLAIACWIFQYGIAIKNLRILSYPNSVFVLAGLGALLLIFAIREMNKVKGSARNPHPITVEDNGFSFPHKGDKREVAFADVKEVRLESDEDDGDSIVIRTGDDEYEFFAAFFEDQGKFDSFAALMDKARQK